MRLGRDHERRESRFSRSSDWPCRDWLPAGARAQQNAAPAVAIDDDDIGGVVTSRFGPGSRGLGHRRRPPISARVSPRLRSPTSAAATSSRTCRRRITRFGCAATVSSTRRRSRPSRASILDLTAEDGAEPRRRGAVLSGDLLGVDDQDPGPEPIPRHRRQGQRHPGEFQDAGAVAQFHQDQWLRQLPSDRQLRDADHLRRARQIRIVAGRLGVSPVGRPGRPRHGALHHRS